jgi:hypothetical protein
MFCNLCYAQLGFPRSFPKNNVAKISKPGNLVLEEIEASRYYDFGNSLAGLAGAIVFGSGYFIGWGDFGN